MPARRPRAGWISRSPRRRAGAADPRSRHDAVLYRQPLTTLDDHLARGLRVEALRELVEGFERARRGGRRRPGCRWPRLRPAGPPAAVAARLLRLRGSRPDDVGAPGRRGSRGLVPAADLLLQQRLRDPRAGRPDLVAGGLAGARLRAGGGRRWSTRRRVDLSPERAEEAIGGYTIFNDWSARDLQREETVRPARAGQGQGLRELVRTVAGHARTSWPTPALGPATTWR